MGIGTPQDSGISLQTVLELGPTVPLFGVCMGLQCIGEAFGGVLLNQLYWSFCCFNNWPIWWIVCFHSILKKRFIEAFKTLRDFFPICLYLGGMVEVCTSWHDHHCYKKGKEFVIPFQYRNHNRQLHLIEESLLSRELHILYCMVYA